jgi:predicted nucleotidyltransferase
MRLTDKEVKSILSTFQEVFKSGKIYLFGSRVDNNKRGGDIDLYIQTDNRENLGAKKIDFLVELKRKIGEQKIDIVISRDINRPIEQEAISKGIKLW